MIDVYGTLGPSCASAEVLTQMFLAGMTGVRLNLSHVSLRESEGLLNVLHDAAQRAGVKPLLLVDLQGPELRIGPMGKPAELREDEEVRLCSEEAFSLSCSGEGAPSSPGYGGRLLVQMKGHLSVQDAGRQCVPLVDPDLLWTFLSRKRSIMFWKKIRRCFWMTEGSFSGS